MATSTPRDWYKIQASTSADTAPASADVYIYEQIGIDWWGDGIGAKQLTAELASLDVEMIRVHLNSPGGLAWEGTTIQNALRAHPARIEVIVDGIAASSASVVAMAGDKITMNRGSQLMVHDPWSYAVGPAKDLRQAADVLDSLADSLADVYAARAGADRAHWRAAMAAETWYTAEEAVAAGLADEWVDAAGESDAVARFDMSRFGYAHAGRHAAPAPLNIPDPPASPEPGCTITKKEDVMAYDDLKEGLRTRLGVAEAEPNDEMLLAALDEALAEGDEPQPTPATANTIVVDAEVFAGLQRDAQDGRDARAEQVSTRRDGIVSQALREGRIAPASRNDWRTALNHDEDGTVKLLATLPKGTIPLAEVGHSDELSDSDALYAVAWGTDPKGA